MPDVARIIRPAPPVESVRIVRSDTGPTIQITRADEARVVVSREGPPGPPGHVVGGRAEPITTSGTWSSLTVTHSYAYLPDVWITDASGRYVEADVEYPDATHVAITFPAPFTGTVTIG